MQLRICAQDNGGRVIARPMLLWRCECQLIKEDARPQPVWSSGQDSRTTLKLSVHLLKLPQCKRKSSEAEHRAP